MLLMWDFCACKEVFSCHFCMFVAGFIAKMSPVVAKRIRLQILNMLCHNWCSCFVYLNEKLAPKLGARPNRQSHTHQGDRVTASNSLLTHYEVGHSW